MAEINFLPGPIKRYWMAGKFRPLPPLVPVERRPVDVQHDPNDFLACMLGSLGFSTRCIEKYTRLTPGQITYRLKKGCVSRMDYKNGKSIIAQQILRVAPKAVTPLLNRELLKAIHDTPAST